jgi:hypothetical protein
MDSMSSLVSHETIATLACSQEGWATPEGMWRATHNDARGRGVSTREATRAQMEKWRWAGGRMAGVVAYLTVPRRRDPHEGEKK